MKRKEGEDKMIEVEYVTLEDGMDYFIVDTLDEYVYLKKDDETDEFCVRKVERIGDEAAYLPLSNDEELHDALEKFYQKYMEN